MNPEKPEWCDFCEWATEVLTLTGADESGSYRQQGTDPLWLCDLCRSTHAGNAALYPSQHERDEIIVLKTMIYLTHTILDAYSLRRSS